MKKLFLIFIAIIGFGLSASAQNIIIQQNNNEQQRNSSNTTTVTTRQPVRGIEQELNGKKVIITNYNGFSVDCYYSIRYSYEAQVGNRFYSGKGNEETISGTKIIKPNASFVVDVHQRAQEDHSSWDNISVGSIDKIICNCYKF